MDLAERSTSTAGRHPWELARSTHFRCVIRDAVELAGVGRLLDIGAGDGWFAEELLADLSPDASVTCWDINYGVDDLTTDLPDRITRAVEQPVGRFDLVLLMDVLEHIRDDTLFLQRTVAPLLTERGTLVVSVPMHPLLFTSHDTMLGHCRRYTRTGISDLLRSNFEVVLWGSMFSSLVPLRAAQAGLEKVREAVANRAENRGVPKGKGESNTIGVGGWQGGRLLTRSLTAVLDADARLGRAAAARGHPLSGLSFWAVCRPQP